MNPKPNGKLHRDGTLIVAVGGDGRITYAQTFGKEAYADGLVETYNSMLDEIARYHALLGDDPQKVADVVNAAKVHEKCWGEHHWSQDVDLHKAVRALVAKEEKSVVSPETREVLRKASEDVKRSVDALLELMKP